MLDDKSHSQNTSLAAGSRARRLSREIGFALALTLAALASIFAATPRDRAITASVTGGQVMPAKAE